METAPQSAAARPSPRARAEDPAADPLAAAVEFPPDQSVGYLLRDTHRAFMRILQTRIAADNVTVGMWFFLRTLWEEDGLSQRELSRRIKMMEPTTVTALSMMERRGLIRRERDPVDRRRSLVYLTDKGRSLKERLLGHAIEANRIALGGMTEEEKSDLRRLLHIIKRNLETPAASKAG